MYRYKMLIALCLLALHTHYTVAMNTSGSKNQNPNKTTLTRKKQSSQKKFVPKTQKVLSEKIQDEEVADDITSIREPKIETPAETTDTGEPIISTISAEAPAIEEAKNQNSSEEASLTPTKSAPSTTQEEAPAQTKAVAPSPTYVAGLGFFTGLGDWWHGEESNIIQQIQNKTFNAKHPDQQSRTARALKALINKDDSENIGLLFKLMVGIRFTIENSGRMKEVYTYLKNKQIALENTAKDEINSYLEGTSKNLDLECKKCQTTFGAQLPLLQMQIKDSLDTLGIICSKHTKAVNSVKIARINGIKINNLSHQDYTGYNSDTDENKPTQYDEDIFLQRPHINLYNNVNDFEETLKQNHTKLATLQQEFEKISFLPAIKDTK